MDSTIARVGSAALIDLQNDLTLLSKSLLKIYELMDADMRKVNVAWQDGKYQEFVQGYKPQIEKCEKIANRYIAWCSKVLEPTIQNAVAAENVNVSGDEAVGAVVGATAAVGGAGIASAAGAVGKNRAFNLSGHKESPEEGAIINSLSNKDADIITPQKKVVPRPGINDDSLTVSVSNIADPCGPGEHAKLTSFTVKKGSSHSDPTWDVGGDISAEAGVTGVKGKVSLGAKRHSSNNSNNMEFTGDYQCVPDGN